MTEATKPHHFELVMNSYSNGLLNQEVVLVREYANTPAQLTAKQMQFTKFAAAKIVAVCIEAMDEMSMPLQTQGFEELMAMFAEFGAKPPKAKVKRK
jgi:hypothetical protein